VYSTVVTLMHCCTQTANAKPREKVIWRGRDCKDGFYDKEKKLTCGVFKDAQNERIWDSQVKAVLVCNGY